MIAVKVSIVLVWSGYKFRIVVCYDNNEFENISTKKKKNNEFEIVVIFFDVKMCFRLLASREEKFGEEFKIA